jgi:dGTPase
VLDVLISANLTYETRRGIGGHSKGKNDLTAFDGEPTSTLEAAVVRIADRVAYMNHDLDDALRSGLIEAIPSVFADLGATHGKRISRMVYDVIENSLEQPAIRVSPSLLATMNELKDWLFDNVYERYPVVFPDVLKAERIVRELFLYYLEPGRLPEGFEGVQGAVDYVAGMTDRFAIDTYTRLFIPTAFDDRIARVP